MSNFAGRFTPLFLLVLLAGCEPARNSGSINSVPPYGNKRGIEWHIV
jgi:hypothetical protein